MNTTKINDTVKTSDRWIKVDENKTLVLTALTRITDILYYGNKIKICYGESSVVLEFPTPAEAEAYRDEILAKIDRL